MKTLLWFCGLTLAATLAAFLTQSWLGWPFWTVLAIAEVGCFATTAWLILPRAGSATSASTASQQTEEEGKMAKRVGEWLLYSGPAILVALLIKLVSGWSFWAIFVLAELGYFAVILWRSYPIVAKLLAGIGTVLVAVQLVGLLLGRTFPLSWDSLSYGIGARDTQLTKAMDRGLAKADQALVFALRKQEDEMATNLPALLAAKDTNGIAKLYLQQVQLRQTIEAIMSSNRPVQPPTPATTPARGGVASFTVNQDEVVSTLSVPDNSTVYLEADKAFCILERYGINDDGSEKTSKLTIPPGKSSRHFAWGGTLRLVGLYTNTTVKLHL